jgi:hypothetical protein
MSAPETGTKIIALSIPLHEFLMELMHRATERGLIVPDELPYAAGLWERIKTAPTVPAQVMAKADPSPGAQAAPQVGEGEGVSAQASLLD